MATRWMRWNETTHIFEYSTDGVAFNPLPLSMATITEGSLNPALLPANVAKVDAANVFTAALPISIESAAPILQYKETDQAVDSRFWREAIEAGTFKVQALSDALAATDLFTLNRSGAFNFTQGADHQIGSPTGLGALANRLLLINPTAGAARYTSLILSTDIANQALLHALSSGYTTSGWNIAAGVTLGAAGAGGLNIAASHASGVVNLYAGGVTTPALRIPTAGGAILYKTADAATLTLTKSALATSGVNEGGLLITGFGLAHFGIGFTPYTGGASKVYMGFGSNNAIETFTKHIQLYHSITIANNATFNTTNNFTSGIMVISNASGNRSALFCLCASGSFATEVSDPAAGFSGVINTASMINVYYAGGGLWTIQNLTGGSVTVTLTMIGYAV